MDECLDEYIVVTRLIQSPKGATVYELAEALGKTTRAVYMIIEKLNSMYFPLWTEPDPDNPKMVRYHADSSFAEYLPSLNFSDVDKAVFNYLLDSSDKTPAMEAQARHLFTKIRLMASERGALLENNNGKKPLIISSPTFAKKTDNKKAAKIIASVIDSIAKKQWVTFDYHNIYTGINYKFTIFPLVLFVDQGNYYLYAFNKNEQLRMLAVERINEVVSCSDGVVPAAKVNVKALLEDPFGIIYDTEPFRVKLHIDEDEAMFVVQKKWPESVTITKQDNGSIIFETTTHSYFDCKSWIMQRAASLTVLEPDWLIDDIKETLQQGLKRYSN